MLKGKTGITPNILCRLGLCLSLGEEGNPVSDDSALSDREINRYTLLGEYDRLFVSLLRRRHSEVALDGKQLTDLFVQHIHRGITLLWNRVRSPAMILDLVPAIKDRETNPEG